MIYRISILYPYMYMTLTTLTSIYVPVQYNTLIIYTEKHIIVF